MKKKVSISFLSFYYLLRNTKRKKIAEVGLEEKKGEGVGVEGIDRSRDGT